MFKKVLLLTCLVFHIFSMVFAQQHLIIHSKFLQQPDTVCYFIPATYSKNEFPAVILLHGWNGNHCQWNKIISLQSLADSMQMVFICPDGLKNSWYINSPIQKSSSWSDFFRLEFFPEIIEKLPIDTNKVFITGLSMGGYGALYNFSLNPHRFIMAGSISGTVNLNHPTLSQLGIQKHFGKNSVGQNQEYNLIESLKKANVDQKKKILISCGEQDIYYNDNVEFFKNLASFHANALFLPAKGGHNYKYWKEALMQQLNCLNEYLLHE